MVELARRRAAGAARRVAGEGSRPAGPPAHRGAGRGRRRLHRLLAGLHQRHLVDERGAALARPHGRRSRHGRRPRPRARASTRPRPTEGPARRRRRTSCSPRFRPVRPSSTPAAPPLSSIEDGAWAVRAAVSVVDVSQPLNASRWVVRDGRLPATTDEVALGADEVRRLQAHLGDTVVLTTTSGAEHVVRLTLVGVVAPYASWGSMTDGVVLPGVLPVDPTYAGPIPSMPAPGESANALGYLATTSRPLTWTDVRALNARGAIVVSRSLLESPPPFCAVDQMCLDHGPVPQPAAPLPRSSTPRPSTRRPGRGDVGRSCSSSSSCRWRCSPARRSPCSCAAVSESSVSSARAAVRRPTCAAPCWRRVSCSASPGGVLGVAIGWTAVLLLGGPLPWAPLAGRDVHLGVPPLPWYVLGVAAIGVIAAVVASLVPGRPRGTGRRRRRAARPSPAARAADADSRRRAAARPRGHRGPGVRPGEGRRTDPRCRPHRRRAGLVLVMPWLVVQTGRLGRWMPLSAADGGTRLRAAPAAHRRGRVRDRRRGGRARSRPRPRRPRRRTSRRRPTWPTPQARWRCSRSSTARPPSSRRLVDAATSRHRRGGVRRHPALPPACSAAWSQGRAEGRDRLRQFRSGRLPRAGRHGAGSRRAAPGGSRRSHRAAPRRTGAWQSCGGRTATNGSVGGEVMVLEDPADLGLLLGPIAAADVDAGRAELERGGAVVLQPGP